MRLTATRIGTAVPHTFAGVVRGVFGRACTIDLSDAHGDVRVLALVAEDVPMTPVSIGLPVARVRGLALAGDRVHADGGVLHCGPIDVGLADAERYDGLVDGEDWEGPPADHGADWLTTALLRAKPARDLPILARLGRAEVARRIGALARSITESDPHATELNAAALIGLGPGSTPSGDDALCGFMLGRRLLGEATEADRSVRHVASNAWESTVGVSAQHLALAARGQFGEALLHVALGIRDHERFATAQAARRCIEQGATSGEDALVGLTASLRTGTRGLLTV